MHSNKILLVTSEFPPQPGGLGNHSYNLANQLAKQKYAVTLITDVRSSNGEAEKKFDSKLNFNVIRTRRYQILLFTYFKRFLEYRKYFKNNKPKMVFASGRFSIWLVIFGFKNNNFKRIAVIHGSEINSKVKWQRKLTDIALKKFELIIAVSHYTKSLISNLKLNTIHVIPNGIEKDKFIIKEKGPKLKGYPKLVTVGTLSERKGQHNVINKLPQLVQLYPDIHYHLIGIPSERDKLQAMAKLLKVENHITFHGVLEDIELIKVVSNSDIFVMLSAKTKSGDVEGFGIALLEANFLGLPTIGSKGCGIEDAIDNYKSGILVNHTSFKEFAQAINVIEEQIDLYKINAHEWALKHSWDIIIKKYIKLTQDL